MLMELFSMHLHIFLCSLSICLAFYLVKHIHYEAWLWMIVGYIYMLLSESNSNQDAFIILFTSQNLMLAPSLKITYSSHQIHP